MITRTLAALCLLSAPALAQPAKRPPAADGASTPFSARATPANELEVPRGFRVELLHSASKEQGSWVSMTFDPKGRVIASDQYGPLYRVTVPPPGSPDSAKVERLPAPVGECQGLLWAYDSLYCTANVRVSGKAEDKAHDEQRLARYKEKHRSGLFRLRDRDGDDRFEEVELLKELFDDRGRPAGGREHGPHAVIKGPDGRLWVIAGNNTQIPKDHDADSPMRNWDEDHILPRRPDGRGHNTGVMAPGGWVASTDPDGKRWRLHAAGLRNPYDIAFNDHGELFTFDADMEWDIGTSWYRPTRINHLQSGAELGWRYGTGKWPAYYVDSVAAAVDIGQGSPTGIVFGYGAKFPARYQRALFALDWSYGRIFAVHLSAEGASYKGTSELFVSGKPLPVTDAAIGPDGALYFTTGGRNTQTGLYRVSYTGNEPTAAAETVVVPAAAKARELRRRLESFHGREAAEAVATAWPQLGSPDRAIRYAARVAIEHQPLRLWQARALEERRPDALIAASVALVRNASAKTGGLAEGERRALLEPVTRALLRLPLARMKEPQLLDALRALQLTFIRLGRPTPELATRTVKAIARLYPHPGKLATRELAQLLVYLEAPGVVGKTLDLLAKARKQDDEVHFAFVLRNAKTGWTSEQKRTYFTWLARAQTEYKGGASWSQFIEGIRGDALTNFVPESERAALGTLLQPVPKVDENVSARAFVREWSMADFEGKLAEVESGRSFERGRAALAAAQCLKCHMFQGEGAGVGPDLSYVGNRFSPRELLESILQPSAVISDQYQTTQLVLKNGDVVTGALVEDAQNEVVLRPSALADEKVRVRKSDIANRGLSDVSMMPEGLVMVLERDEILDMLAYLRAGGKREDRAFRAVSTTRAQAPAQK